MTYLRLTPRDPVVARDGRPFGRGSGRRMKSLEWLLPSVAAGAARTMLGKTDARGFSLAVVKELKEMAVAGPLAWYGGKLYFAAPKDFVLQAKPRQCFRVRPRKPVDGDYCDLPGEKPGDEKLWPVLLPESVTEDFKPEAAPAWWSEGKMTAWLMEGDFATPPKKDERTAADGFLEALERDERTHAAIEAERGAAAEHMLYGTVSLAFPEGLAISLRVADAMGKLAGLHPVGGERRLVEWRKDEAANWQCDPELARKLGKAERIRMVLATPALFGGGWRPGWLDGNLEGTPPGTGVTLRLVGAAVERWRAVSGFGLEEGLRGPKPVRRMAPAGSVYFFEYVKGERATLAGDGWLAAVSDLAEDGQDRRDGFGLALWGIWSE